MPSRKIHNIITKAILGKSYDELHRVIDLPAKEYGIHHRKYGHDLKSAVILAILTKDPKAFTASIIHTATDQIVTELKKERAKKNAIDLP